MEYTRTLLLASGLLLLGLCACGSDDPQEGAAGGGSGGSAGSAGTAGTGGGAGSAGAAGQAGSGSALTSQNSVVSDCGGFEAGNRGPVGYCDAEKLMWAYDASTGTLSLLDARVMLNCCGEHSFDVYYDATTGKYEGWEIDAPEMIGTEPSRCNCSCVFDFRTEIVDVQSSTIELVLMRHETDQGAAQQVWSGTLELTAGSGEVILDDQPMDYGCGEY